MKIAHGLPMKDQVLGSPRAISVFLVLLLTLLALAAGPARAEAPQGLVIGWGSNDYGQLPTTSAIAAGAYHSLALTPAGEVIA